jgi:hypothetical protein
MGKQGINLNSCMVKISNASVIVYATPTRPHSYILHPVRARVTGAILVKSLHMGNHFPYLFKIILIPRRFYILMFQLNSTLMSRSCV